ncbi:putative pyrophosphorylase ModD [Peptoclostridium acidaminophilum DSM 3953]|uniref:Putative pyrophosphorylase ModD n=1 Tax=Peptoclostridium acidaminophilum DSM 3953 TaxID=1286171 RepID=W8T655_PEPAC|nr:ModD protein [Peptoclostridium acidaminophilum]AHM57214.1 putative pyrophosphorylase ModD [Peptoclostridium acidaminophilum DSM 3953]
MYISDETIEKFIKEDIPYLDLTSCILNIAEQKGKIRFVCREEAVICGTEEVIRIFKKFDVTPVNFVQSGTKVGSNTVIIEGEGDSEKLHMVWKVSMNILEYACGIATRTWRLIEKARVMNPNIQVVTTRKGFPGTKELSIKAVVCGGGFPHRLGLSESVLIFPQHIAFLGGVENLLKAMDSIKAKACENKVIVEVERVEEAIKVCEAGADGVQVDKMKSEELHEAVKILRNINPNLVILAAGGINISNVEDYAKTGVNAIVTSAVYFGKPVDIGTEMEKVT